MTSSRLYPCAFSFFGNFSKETCYLYIPNSAVGAIIGTRGSHIRNIIRFSNATVKIASLPEGTAAEPQAERKVTVIGTPEAQWKVRAARAPKLSPSRSRSVTMATETEKEKKTNKQKNRSADRLSVVSMVARRLST